MAFAFDSCASFASAALKHRAAPSRDQPLVTFTDDEDDALDLAGAYEVGDEEVNLSGEMTPSFFESGQLMWEISAHTEDGGQEEQPSFNRPEIVLTDSSFLSMTGFQDDRSTQDESGREEKAQEDREVENMEVPKREVLSGQHCFELLTDENYPLCGSAIHEVIPNECRGTEGESLRASLPELRKKDSKSGIVIESQLATSPFSASNSEMEQRVSDSERVDEMKHQGEEENKTGLRKAGRSRARTSGMDAAHIDRLASLGTTSSVPDKDSLPISDSASDIFSTYDPKFIIGEMGYVTDLSMTEIVKPPLLTTLSLQPHMERNSPIKPHVGLRRPSPDASPRSHVPGCSLKDVFSNAVSKFNEVVYSCTHTKQRRKEREILKKLQANSRGNLTQNASASCNAYRRRNTLIRQKMEGMIDNEVKVRSITKKSTRTNHHPPSASQSKKKGTERKPPLKA